MLITTAVLLLTQFLALGWAADLEAVTIQKKLPGRFGYISALFDEVDSIYLLGGYNGSPGVGKDSYKIFKYSVTQETLEEVGALPLVSIGNAVWLGSETIGYVGGRSNSSESQSTIWKASTSDLSSWSNVGDLPFGSLYGTSVWDLKENVYTFGGFSREGEEVGNEVTKYDFVQHSAEVITQLPKPSVVFGSSIWDSGNDLAYVFGGVGMYWNENIYKFDPVDGKITLVATSPAQISSSCAVWTGEFTYVIAYGSLPSLLRFDPYTNQMTQIPVSNFPSELDGTGCTFVKSLNRMYIFGGYDNEQRLYTQSIIYIDLE